MKFLFMLPLLVSTYVQADELLCASARNQSLYYSTGQVRLTAQINNETSLDNLRLTITGSSLLGVNEAVVDGTVVGRYKRFNVSDAWCNYRITLPSGFMTRSSTPAFLDANCEENTNSSIRLNCVVQ